MKPRDESMFTKAHMTEFYKIKEGERGKETVVKCYLQKAQYLNPN
jgi:hypothetical protein